MPVWCPKCGAMLADGTERCPRCDTKLEASGGGEADLSTKEIWNLTFYILRILLVPVLVALVIGLICYLTYFR